MTIPDIKAPVNIGCHGGGSAEWMSQDCVRCPHCGEVHDLGDYPPCDWDEMWRTIYSDSGDLIEIECQTCDKPIRFTSFLTVNVMVRDDKNGVGS
jgi:hypothetical protein